MFLLLENHFDNVHVIDLTCNKPWQFNGLNSLMKSSNGIENGINKWNDLKEYWMSCSKLICIQCATSSSTL